MMIPVLKVLLVIPAAAALAGCAIHPQGEKEEREEGHGPAAHRRGTIAFDGGGPAVSLARPWSRRATSSGGI